MTLIDWVHDAGRVITSLDDKVEVLRKEVQRLKDGGDPDVVAMAKRRASKAQSLADHFKIELEEATRWREEAAFRIVNATNRALGELADSKAQLQTVRAQVCLMENELLKLTRSMETLRVDLSRQAVEDYKKSTGFEMGLVRMGRVSLEYDYQLALARFRA
ncbi:hypothetical protein BHE74_00026734 [Ensete ventricosum]|nr:hypothetical protein BHE74_00026734 [Ensete ventricosum]